jgi:hypothetical protein
MLGRKTVLTEDTIKRLCEARSIGGTYAICAQYAGIALPTLSLWLRRGAALQEGIEDGSLTMRAMTQHERKIIKFLRLFRDAEINDTMNLLAVIDKEASSNPAYAKQRLQWRYPGDFSTVERRDITSGGMPVQQATTVVEIVVDEATDA